MKNLEDLSVQELEELLAQRKEASKVEKKKKNFSKFIVTLVIVLNIIFTIAVFWAFVRVGNEPTALIGAWFGFTTGELWMLSSIKKTKVKKEEENAYDEGDYYQEYYYDEGDEE